MCDRGSSSPVLFPTFKMWPALSFSSNQLNYIRADFYLSLPFRDVSTTHLRTFMEGAFVLHGSLKSGRSSALKDFNLYWTDCLSTDFKQSGGWKIECTDWCSLMGRRWMKEMHLNIKNKECLGLFLTHSFLFGGQTPCGKIHLRLSLSPDRWGCPTNWSL